jgi:hypothetical protein
MNCIRQARLPLSGEQRVALNTTDQVFVGVQNIALARIDTVSKGVRRVTLNLFGVRDIDRLIAALQSARATLVAESDALNKYLAEHPEAVLPAAEAIA